MTRASFFAAITGAVAAALPGKSETFQECAECAAKPGSPVLCADCLRRRDGYKTAAPKVEEFAPKGKMFVLSVESHTSEHELRNLQASLAPFEEQLGCTFMICPRGYSIYDPALAPNEAMVERIAERVAEKIKPDNEFPVRTSAGLLCECGYEMLAVGGTLPTPSRRLFECVNPNCRRHGIKVWEPMYSGRTAEPPSYTYNIDARGADREFFENRVVAAIRSAHQSANRVGNALANNLPPQR